MPVTVVTLTAVPLDLTSSGTKIGALCMPASFDPDTWRCRLVVWGRLPAGRAADGYPASYQHMISPMDFTCAQVRVDGRDRSPGPCTDPMKGPSHRTQTAHSGQPRKNPSLLQWYCSHPIWFWALVYVVVILVGIYTIVRRSND